MSSTFDGIAGRLDYPMIVVTTAAGDERGGCLVGFHTQCSIDPPRYAVWISKANHTARVAAAADVFALHFLDGATQRERQLAELFGTVTDDEGDKFSSCAWHGGPDGVPLLDECPTRVVARRHAVFDDDGDHTCYVLVPETTDSAEGFTPMMFSQVRDLEAGHDVS